MDICGFSLSRMFEAYHEKSNFILNMNSGDTDQPAHHKVSDKFLSLVAHSI